MRTITIDINNSIYEHIMFFLKNLPSHLVNIHSDNKENVKVLSLKNESLRGVFQSYANPQKQVLEKDAWKNHVLDKYRSSLDDKG